MIKKLKNATAFFDYSQTIDDVYKNNNPKSNQKKEVVNSV